jgi:phenylalanyl-tRNA synthetase alpha subunit
LKKIWRTTPQLSLQTLTRTRLANGRKKYYIANSDTDVQKKKMNKTEKQKVSQLNDQHKKQLVNFYGDQKPTATIKDGVEKFVKNFEGLNIKKSRVAESIKDKYSFSMKSVTRHSVQINTPKLLNY